MFSLFKKDKPESALHDPAAEPATPPATDTPDRRSDEAADLSAPISSFDVSALIEPPPSAAQGGFAPVEADAAAMQEVKPKVVQAISTVFDPEIPVNIFELGLVYDIRVGADRRVWIDMTLTSPNCPSAQALPQEVQYKTRAVPGVTDAHVEIVWEPPWSMEKMSDAARLQLGLL